MHNDTISDICPSGDLKIVNHCAFVNDIYRPDENPLTSWSAEFVSRVERCGCGPNLALEKRMVPGDTGLAIDDVVLVGDVRSMHRLDDGGGGLPREDIDSEDKVADWLDARKGR